MKNQTINVTMETLMALKVKDLREMAKAIDLEKRSSMNKKALAEALVEWAQKEGVEEFVLNYDASTTSIEEQVVVDIVNDKKEDKIMKTLSIETISNNMTKDAIRAKLEECDVKLSNTTKKAMLADMLVQESTMRDIPVPEAEVEIVPVGDLPITGDTREEEKNMSNVNPAFNKLINNVLKKFVKAQKNKLKLFYFPTKTEEFKEEKKEHPLLKTTANWYICAVVKGAIKSTYPQYPVDEKGNVRIDHIEQTLYELRNRGYLSIKEKWSNNNLVSRDWWVTPAQYDMIMQDGRKEV